MREACVWILGRTVCDWVNVKVSSVWLLISCQISAVSQAGVDKHQAADMIEPINRLLPQWVGNSVTQSCHQQIGS